MDMIDRDARNRLAESLRHLVSGQITNDEFEDAAWIDSEDAIIDAVKWQASAPQLYAASDAAR